MPDTLVTVRSFKWDSVVNDGRLFHNDYQYISSGYIDEHNARFLCAKVNTFEAIVMRQPVSFACTAVVNSPVGTGLDNGVPTVFAFPPPRDYSGGLRPATGEIKAGVVLLVTKQVDYGRSGRMALPFVLGSDEIGKDSGGRYRFKKNPFYEQFRQEYALELIGNPNDNGVKMGIGKVNNLGGSVQNLRQVRGLNPAGVMDLAAMRRSGYFNAFPQGERFMGAAVLGISKLRIEIARMRYEAGLEHDYHDPKLKSDAQATIGYVEGLFAQMKSFYEKPMEGDDQDAQPVVVFRTRGPSAGFLCQNLPQRVKGDANAAYERIAAMPERVIGDEKFMLNEDVKLLGELMEPFANQVGAVLFGDWSNPYLLHPSQEGEGSETHQKLIDKYFEEAKKFPNKPPRMPPSLFDVALKWQEWHDARQIVIDLIPSNTERKRRFSRHRLHNWPQIGATDWNRDEEPA